jgi:N-acetyl-anhydromuramyl-L-alanine amidase AmpD
MARRFLTKDGLRRTPAVLGTGVAVLAVTAALGGAAVPRPQALAAGHPSVSRPAAGSRMALFLAAARQSGVPAGLLLAIGYNESRWEPHGTMPSADGGYGLMNLTTRTFTVASAQGKGKPRAVTLVKTHYTLDEAARLLHVPAGTLKISDAANVRGAAAVLAGYARRLGGGRLPATLGGWYGAVAEYSGAPQQKTAQLLADDVFSTLRTGASLVTSDGQAMRLAASPAVRPDRAMARRLGLQPPPRSAAPVDCPANLNCQFVPAAYAENPGGNPQNYGNYDTASRPQDMTINSIVIHDTESSYAAAIATFQNSQAYVSANYVIQSSTGNITEMVRPQDVAWAVGDWYDNTHSISIEHEGFAAQGSVWYTQVMYKASADLVRYLAQRFGVPLDRQHIIGHDNVPGPTDAYTAAQHWDPGPFWNWTYYMSLLHGVSQRAERASGGSATRGTHQVVTIDPVFATNQPPVTDCSGGTCKPLPKQPANFVYLHTQPSASAPLLSDPTLHSGGTAGTTEDADWGDKAPTGEKYVIAGQQGNWTGIWYAGTIGWFYNPPGAAQTGLYTGAAVVMAKPGLTSVPVYGSAFPEASAYPKVVPVQPNVPLTYTILPGQAYVTTGSVPDDYYYAVTFNSSMPDDHTVIRGKTAYYQIVYNHRLFFVKAADVVLKNLP